MRLVYEHPWSLALSICIIGAGFVYVGVRDGVLRKLVIGLVIWLLATVTCVIGLIIDTPSEYAKNVVYAFIKAVENNDIASARELLADDVLLVDSWRMTQESGVRFVEDSISELHYRHTFTNNAVLRCEIIEREGDVLVELSLICRVSGIGTVPSRWRLLLRGLIHDDWRIYSIDAIEIAGRSYR